MRVCVCACVRDRARERDTYLPEFLDGSREKGNKHREGVLNAFLHVPQRLIEGCRTCKHVSS